MSDAFFRHSNDGPMMRQGVKHAGLINPHARGA
jgi:hypothetical protein